MRPACRRMRLPARAATSCATAADGEISKLRFWSNFYDQVVVTVKCLLAMQQATADQLKGAAS